MKQIIVRNMTLSDLICNVYYLIQFWFYRLLVPYSPQRSEEIKDGWNLFFYDDFDKKSWSKTGEGKQWRYIHCGDFHPNKPIVYYGEPELVEHGSCARFTASYNPKTFLFKKGNDKDIPDTHIVIPYEISTLTTTNESLKAQYGRYECRMTLPKGHGVWPAFWMWGHNAETKDEYYINKEGERERVKHYTEIDCGEWYSDKDGKGVGVQCINLHYWYTDNKHVMRPWKVRIDKDSNADRFHEYAFEWSPDKIECFVDGVKIFRYTRKDVLDFWYNMKNTAMWVVINASINPKYVGLNEKDYHTEFLVDYIRAYKKSNNVSNRTRFQRF